MKTALFRLAKTMRVLLALTVVILTVARTAAPVYAASCSNTAIQADFIGSPPPKEITYSENPSEWKPMAFTIQGRAIIDGQQYQLQIEPRTVFNNTPLETITATAVGNKLSFVISGNVNPGAYETPGWKNMNIVFTGGSCTLWDYNVNDSVSCTIQVSQRGVANPGCLDATAPIDVDIINVREGSTVYDGDLNINHENLSSSFNISPVSPGKYKFQINPVMDNIAYDIGVSPVRSFSSEACHYKTIPAIKLRCSDEAIKPPTVVSEFNLCKQIPNTNTQEKCAECQSKNGIWTAVGCIIGTSEEIVGTAIELGLGIGGGIALLMILIAAFELSTSQGEPKRTSEARERLSAAVIGLLFIVFSVTILQFIGVTILHIPGFGE